MDIRNVKLTTTIFGVVFLFVTGVILNHTGILHAANVTQLSQVIDDGVLTVDIVDANGNPVVSPSISFSSSSFSFSNATSTASLGTESEKIRLSNPTNTATWSVTLAATDGSTASWSDGGTENFDFNDELYSEDGNDTDLLGGRLAIDPSSGSLVGINGCLTADISLGSSIAFIEGVTDSATLFSASASASTYCRWDLTSVSLVQSIPPSQEQGTYTLDMTLTAS